MTSPPDSAPTGEAAIVADRLSFSYPGGRVVLNDLSFRIEPGERIGLVGPSGAGKSTLLLHLCALLPDPLPRSVPEPPPLTIAGQVPTRRHAAEVRSRVGLVFQNPDDQLFCPTVEEDIAFGPLNQGLDTEAVRERITETLSLVDLEGYEKRRVLELSYGERKRVALAGIFACRPDVLLLDEPFSNLDPRSRRNILTILDRLPQTQLIATHDLPIVVELCTRVLVLDGGRIEAEGTTREILSDSELMQRHGLEVPWQYLR